MQIDLDADELRRLLKIDTLANDLTAAREQNVALRERLLDQHATTAVVASSMDTDERQQLLDRIDALQEQIEKLKARRKRGR